MMTRAQFRNAAANGDSLVRPPIWTQRRGKAVDLETVYDGKEAKTASTNSKSLNESVTKKESHITRKTVEPSQEGNHSYSSSDQSSSESDDENNEHQKYNSTTLLSASKDEEEQEEADKARSQQRKDTSFRRDYSLTKHISSEDEDALDQYRLRQRKGKSKDEDLPIQVIDLKKAYPHYNTTISADKKLVNAKTADPLFSEDETEEQPRPSPGRSTPNYSEKKKNLHLIYTVILLLLVGALLLAVWLLNTEKLSSQKAADKLHILNSFSDGFRKLPIRFPSQSQDLWQRSQRMLNAHLNRDEENKGPAIILLTSAQDGKKMLYCIANQLAKAYASSRNSSYTVLSELDKISETSEEVKLYIDKRLSEGFQTNKAAVLHRIELLPPGSVLILYKYCDHENAAFQNVALVLTVLLNNSTLTSGIPLSKLEDAVYHFLKETFIGSKSGASHNEMDGDKLSGVWSRIAHVVLPVLPEYHTVKECEEPKSHLQREDKKLAPQEKRR